LQKKCSYKKEAAELLEYLWAQIYF
jgi:hypothetical protein